MIDRTKLPTIRTRPPPPRRRRHHHHSGQEPSVATPKVMAALAALVLGILWTVGVLFFSLTVTVPDGGSGSTGGSGRRGQERSLDNLPNINLWPNDETNLILNEHLADCLPQKCTLKSSLPQKQQKQKQQQPIVITILRPPGVFGSVLESFTRGFIKNLRFDKGSIIVQAKSQSPPDAAAAAAAALTDDTAGSTTARKIKQKQQKQQEYYVHAVTLPLLLQAADLALLTVSDEDGFPKERITWNDLLDVIVLLVRWHCRISTHVSITKSNYLLKLGLAPTLSHPTKSEYDLAHLLDIDLNNYDSSTGGGGGHNLGHHPSWVVDRGPLSVMVLKRVDQATALLRQMHGFLPGDSTQDLQQAVDLLLQEEFHSSSGGDDQYYCPTQPLRSGGIAGLGLFRWHSRMIDIVDLLLDDNTELVCQEYPTIAYCREQQQKQHQ